MAEDLRVSDPEALEVLLTVTEPFRFVDDSTYVRSRKTFITPDTHDEVLDIRLNIHLADILALEPARLKHFYRAYRLCMEKTRSQPTALRSRFPAQKLSPSSPRPASVAWAAATSIVTNGTTAFAFSTGRGVGHATPENDDQRVL